jgi:hypothetical protein
MNEEVRGIDIAHDRAGHGPRSSSCMAPSATAVARQTTAEPAPSPLSHGERNELANRAT